MERPESYNGRRRTTLKGATIANRKPVDKIAQGPRAKHWIFKSDNLNKPTKWGEKGGIYLSRLKDGNK